MATFNYKDENYNNFKLNEYPPPSFSEINRRYRTRKDPPTEESKFVKYRDSSKLKTTISNSMIQKPEFVFRQDWKGFERIVLEPVQEQFCKVACPKEIYDAALNLKKQMFELDNAVLRESIKKGNPYEGLAKTGFMNRSAAKLLELDHVFKLTTESKSFTFVDLCGGPGGFTEYLLWKTRSINRFGWGISLRGVQDFDLNAMIAKPKDSEFTVDYGADDSGDLYQLKNIDHFVKKVLSNRKNGVDLVVADGGFSVKGDEAHQEFHSKQLIVCEVLSMLRVLKKGGSFVLKVFDVVTPFTVQVIYFMYLYFESIALVKPLSSQPGNSERYLVCKALQEFQPQDLISYFTEIATTLSTLKPNVGVPKSGHSTHQPGFINFDEQVKLGLKGISSILNMEMIEKDSYFIDSMDNWNTFFYCRLKDSLKDIISRTTDPDKDQWDHELIARKCFREWNFQQ